MDDRLKATIASLDDDRAGKAFGGSLSSDDPNKFFSDVLKYSFAVLPLLRPGYLKEVPKQGFAEGGSVDDALHVARQAAQQGGGLWDLLKRSAGEMAEMVEPGSTTRETPSVREVAESMLPRDPYEVVGEAQKKFKEGDKIGAFEEMLGGIPQTGAIRAYYSPSEIGKYGAIRGYHLSPHEFEKFTPGVGVGTGAQTEGVGTYISSNPEGAKMWESAMPEGKKHLYEVHAPIDESTFINRNVPLNRQSLHVKDALEQFNIPSTVPKWTGQQSIDVPATGFDAYQHLRNQYGPEKASQMLSEAGISGMRFPGAGEGSNYVVYDPSILNIVGKQRAYADGGAARFAPIDPSMLVGQSPEPYRGGEAYTDAGGQKVAAPFVTGMEGGYPVFDLGEKPKPDVPSLPAGKNPFEDWLQFSFLSKLMGRTEGGRVDDASIVNTALEVLSDYSK